MLDFLDYMLKIMGAIFTALILACICMELQERLSNIIHNLKYETKLRKKKNQSFKVKVELGYQVSSDVPYEWLITDSGKDLIIHFEKEE